MEAERRWGPWAVGRPPWSAEPMWAPTDLSFGWVIDMWAPHVGMSASQVPPYAWLPSGPLNPRACA